MARACKNRKRCPDNQGFSLIELLISIAVLLIIFVPLMGNFIQSTKMNIKAEKLQLQSNLAASILEGLKGHTMAEIIEQFKDNGIFDILTSMDEGENIDTNQLKILRRDEGTKLYTEVDPSDYGSLVGLKNYYFGIQGIREGGSTYDALIQMDARDYADESLILNDYPMPEAINIDRTVNCLLFSEDENAEDKDRMDQTALNKFKENGEIYGPQWFEMSAAPETDFDPNNYPQYYDEGYIKQYITKTMTVIISQDTKCKITYKIDYNCKWPNWPEGIDTVNTGSYTYEYNNSAKNIYPENVYLFYSPSVFSNQGCSSDIIEVNNMTPNPVNFYVANQNYVSIISPVIINNFAGNNMRLFTNLLENIEIKLGVGSEPGVEGLQNGIVKTEKMDRLYNVTIGLYEHTDDRTKRFQKELEIYTLNSTKEE